MTACEILGAALRRAREERGWSRVQLAKRAGRSEKTIWRLERGECLRSTTLDDMLAALDFELVVTVSDVSATYDRGPIMGREGD